MAQALPADTIATFELAVARYQAGEAAAAASLFAAVLARAPDHADALRLRGLALVHTGQATAALPLLAHARALAPDDPLTHLHHGIGLQAAGRYARAAAMFRRASLMRPDDPVAWINLSAAILALGHAGAAHVAARRAIALAPASAEARYALGLAERGDRNVAGARAAFAQATELAPGFADAWVNLGLACFQLGAIADAVGATRRALEVRPGDGGAAANLAGFLLLQGDFDEALERLRAVLAREPGCVPARLNLANALLLDREPREALAVLEGTAPAGREGAHWRAHRAMALLLLHRNAAAAAELDAIAHPYDAEILILWRRIALAEEAGEATTALVERLAALADNEGAALLEHRVVSHFDLAGLFNKHADSTRAFGHWAAGHRLLARAQPFSRETYARFFAAAARCYDAPRLRTGARAASTDERPVFIVGMPRSGTSLTEQILAAHPRVHASGERASLHRTVLKLAGPALAATSVERLAALDTAALTEASAAYSADLGALDPTAARIADKMPGNALHLGFLATLLPRARVILCRRDPRDIGLSIYQLRFFGYHPYAHDLGDLGWYIGQHETLMAHWRAVLPIPLLEIALADWVEDFPATLRRLLDFLDLPYDAACERFHAQTRRVRTASAEQVRRPINAGGIGRWREHRTHLLPMLAELRAAGATSAAMDDDTPD